MTQRLFLILLMASLSCTWLAAQPSTPVPPEPHPEDVASVDAIIHAIYNTISGDAGEARDWDRFRALFIPEARLIPVQVGPNGTQARTLTVDAWIQGAETYFAKNGFYENEIARTSESYGHITHAFSTYESLREPNGKPFSRGINSIQLMYDDARWWVVTIFWDSEREGQPIPSKYLSK